jgi:hypothetical protein
LLESREIGSLGQQRDVHVPATTDELSTQVAKLTLGPPAAHSGNAMEYAARLYAHQTTREAPSISANLTANTSRDMQTIKIPVPFHVGSGAFRIEKRPPDLNGGHPRGTAHDYRTPLRHGMSDCRCRAMLLASAVGATIQPS